MTRGWVLLSGSRMWLSTSEGYELPNKFPGWLAQRSPENNTRLPTWTVPDPAVQEILDSDFGAVKELFVDDLGVVFGSGQIEALLVFPVNESDSRAEVAAMKVIRRAHDQGVMVDVYFPTIHALRASLDQQELDEWPPVARDEPER